MFLIVIKEYSMGKVPKFAMVPIVAVVKVDEFDDVGMVDAASLH
jgi:hypothetical protein